MAQGEKKGFIARMLEGKERDEEYARSTLPTNRWGLFWDIFKGRFSKLVIVNLLMLIFFIPLILVIVLRYLYIGVQGARLPFSGGIGTGYGVVPGMLGLPEQLTMSTDVIFVALMLVAAMIAAVGISGGMYVIRNMVWTEGIFVANDFWRGIKINVVVVLQATVFCGVLGYLLITSINWATWMNAVGQGNSILNTISIVVSYIAVFVLIMMFLWMLSMGGNYKLKFFQLIKNAFLMSFGLVFQNIFFIICMAIPLIFFLLGSLGNFFMMIGVIIMLLFGISYMLLVWFNYSQWAFDKFFESKREGGKVNRGIYSKVSKDGGQSKAVQEYEANLQAAMSVKSDLSARPIKPITDELKVYELPEAFSREDLKKLRESKEAIVEDTQRYADEHMNDEKYVVYNARFEKLEQEKREQEEAEKKGKDKKKEKSESKQASAEKKDGKAGK